MERVNLVELIKLPHGVLNSKLPRGFKIGSKFTAVKVEIFGASFYRLSFKNKFVNIPVENFREVL